MIHPSISDPWGCFYNVHREFQEKRFIAFKASIQVISLHFDDLVFCAMLDAARSDFGRLGARALKGIEKENKGSWNSKPKVGTTPFVWLVVSKPIHEFTIRILDQRATAATRLANPVPRCDSYAWGQRLMCQTRVISSICRLSVHARPPTSSGGPCAIRLLLITKR